MTRNELVEALADYYGLDYPEYDEKHNKYKVRGYDWEAGCYNNHTWMSLQEVVYALEDLCDEEEDDEDE